MSDITSNDNIQNVQSTEQEVLRPCPFCGNNNIHLQIESTEYFHYCEDCGTETTESYDKQSAITWWNHRPLEDALQARLDTYERLLSDAITSRDSYDTFADTLKAKLDITIAGLMWIRDLFVENGEYNEATEKVDEILKILEAK